MTTHELKTWPEFWDAVARGDKPFEIRRNDRAFQKGDRLRLRKFCPSSGRYLDAYECLCAAHQAATVEADVTYVLSGMGLEPGFVCMGIRLVAETERPS